MALVTGTTNAIVMVHSIVIYKQAGFSNEFIGYLSLLFVPFAARLLWAPFVDSISTKRRWCIATIVTIACLYAAIAFSIWKWGIDPWITLPLLAMATLAAATYEIASDGFFVSALDRKQQGVFTGVKVAFIRIGTVLFGGVLIKFCEPFGDIFNALEMTWVGLFAILCGIFLLLAAYHGRVLPRPGIDQPVISASNRSLFSEAFVAYAKQPGIIAIVSLLLIYRLGEGLLARMIIPFLIDDRTVGGMELTAGDAGLLKGIFGVTAMSVGGVLGGIIVSRCSLRRVIIPLAIIMTLPNAGFMYLAHAQPSITWNLPLTWFSAVWNFNPAVALVIGVEAFGYGLGFSSFAYLQCLIAKGPFRASFMAISTGLMSIGWLVPNFISGLLQQEVGYYWLFGLSIVTSIPGILIITLLPRALFLEDESISGKAPLSRNSSVAYSSGVATLSSRTGGK